ncbi:hypothetical protein M407DRAFT_32608 [Tulasnella calospora MUT 4182]|uniref:PARP catalytic domain-containing protein n=1 Tax=Tulasnella calospora MUT 4182 TaxID=1051891 RepID=A0A0C3PSK8_9AGAM|nr:hypothetical protein M407DRAFT_32608 [Tulasnella calospora MUT 4182]
MEDSTHLAHTEALSDLHPHSKPERNQCSKDAVKNGLEVACLMCKEMPKQTGKRHFCGKTCAEKADKDAPILLGIPKNDPEFADIVKRFTDTWQGSNKLTVHRIYGFVNSKAVENGFQAYQTNVEKAGKWISQGRLPETRNLGGMEPFENVPSGMIQTSLTSAPATVPWFGKIFEGICAKGIYTSAYSSTSHDYPLFATKGLPYRAILLTRVVMGKEYISVLGTTDPNAKAPPAGYHSVAVGMDHSEFVVFQSEAICPSWLVLYS